MAYIPPILGIVSPVNSSTTILGIGGIFTGTSEDVSMYTTITVSVFADQVSATDGLSMQQSVNGTNWDHLDTYTIPASTGKTFHADRGAQFFRLVYTNGGVAQTVFRIQTLYDVTAPMGSSVRPSDARSLQNDMRENVSYMGLYNGTTLDLARGTIANGMLVDVSRIVGALPTGANTIGAVTITGTGGVTATKASATPAATTDISQVVALSPNSPAFIKSADLGVTVTAAAATITTLTLPAPAVGLFHYITRIEMSCYTTVARVGAVAPVIVTSTNLPGTPSWDFSTAAAVGTTERIIFDLGFPLKSSVAATATTIVGPATTSVIWKIKASYYTA